MVQSHNNSQAGIAVQPGLIRSRAAKHEVHMDQRKNIDSEGLAWQTGVWAGGSICTRNLPDLGQYGVPGVDLG